MALFFTDLFTTRERPTDPRLLWQDLGALGARLWFGIGVTALGMLAAAALAPGWRPYIAAIGIALLIALSAFAVGCGIGFIFALPKAVPRDAKAAAIAIAGGANGPSGAVSSSGSRGPPAPATGAEEPDSRRYLETNGSLERISEWLSTMIVGISLTQLYNINSALSGFRDFIAAYARVFPVSEGGATAGVLPAIGPLLLITGALAGFLFMYLYTRLLLSPLFNQTEELLDGGGKIRNPAVATDVVTAGLSRAEKKTFVLGRSRRETSVSLEDAIGRMFRALYKDPPKGFQEALEIGGALSATAARERPDYWFYLSAAFGQQHKYLKAAGDEGGMASARDNALDAAKRAVDLDTAYRVRLALLLDSASTDNDLSDFADDESFKALVTRPPA